jgi:hypothetical protein
MTKKDEGKRTSYSSFTAKKAEKRSRGEEARLRPAINASYSDSLLDAGKLNRRA